MSNSTPTYDALVQSQSGKEITANAFFDAASPATAFGRRASACSGLTWGYYGGTIMVDGVLTQIANGTLTLTASTTNYVETTARGRQKHHGITAGRAIPFYRERLRRRDGDQLHRLPAAGAANDGTAGTRDERRQHDADGCAGAQRDCRVPPER